ncbi:ExbD/TolR family protein [Chlorobium phaeobacteroides]|uniref:Cell division and transport-associated protein TolR n=1 Tax=Chlorobium phaeobacteroides (strain DSM 266 / SMG 266 / 2430) TaxID=290317 RepID=A1BET1_CHLPD|nr:biopolymer transporter ExbD [Chlorobium phaeobacteroides]ABL64908.1 Cell division and transport-associated protein TolR [Chlorobium phaeobacteroides DSM 266]MBV5328624.1 biopolymer transporter ExbD [Chlorobium sp.]
MHSGKGKLLSEINVTPFIDVMLVLLIIFMVTAPMMTHGVKVDTPETTHERMDMDPKAIIISIDSSERVFVNNYQLDVSEVRERLPVILDVKQTGEVYLKADKSLSYGLVMNVMAQIREAGIEKIGMVTDPAPLPAQRLK